MAFRARLAAPYEERQAWPWHNAQWALLPAQELGKGDRRLEAETFLASGYGLRRAIEAQPRGWTALLSSARVYQPSRLKGTLVSPTWGTPFLASTQVYDVRPFPRKWLALEKTSDAAGRFVQQGLALVTCSGSVGRATLAYAPHERVLISHDLLRVEARDDSHWGWIYAYLRSTQARQMMTSSHYGHVVKHLEVSHLNALPVPEAHVGHLDGFNDCVRQVLDLRNRAHECTLQAESLFEREVGQISLGDNGERGYCVHSTAFCSARRRMDGLVHSPVPATLRAHLAAGGKGFSKFCECGYDVWLPSRFRRVPATDGVPFIESSDLFEVNPDITKRIADGEFGDPYRGRVQPGWLLLSRSGQIYGLIGSIALATAAHIDKVVSDDVIRLAPRPGADMRAGYACVALSHPTLGRPIVKSLAYGSSIPHIDPSDITGFEVVRLERSVEDEIADLAEESASLRAEADLLETEIGNRATSIIQRFIEGDMSDVTMPHLR